MNSNSSRLLTGNLPNTHYNYGAELLYQLRLDNYFTFTPLLKYNQSYKNQKADYLRNDTIDDNSFNSDYLTRKTSLGASLQYFKQGENDEWTMFFFISSMARAFDRYSLSTPLGNYAPTLNSWLPELSVSYAHQYAKGNGHMEIQYQLSSEAPSLGMMYGPANTIDPLVTIYRNANLKKTINHHVDVWKSWSFPWHGVNLSASAYWNATHGKISYQKAIDTTTGHYIYNPSNVNGDWDSHANLHMNMRLDSAGLFTMNAMTGYSYGRNVDFDISTNGLSSRLSKVYQGQFLQNLGITYRKDKFSLGLKGSLTSAHVTSNREGFEAFTYNEFNYGMNMNLPLFWKLNFVTDFTVYSRRGYAVAEMNKDDLVWNASLSRSFFKNKLTMTFEAYDLLHQLSKNSLTINSQARTEVRVNTIPNYLMLRAQYHFNILPKKK